MGVLAVLDVRLNVGRSKVNICDDYRNLENTPDLCHILDKLACCFLLKNV